MKTTLTTRTLKTESSAQIIILIDDRERAKLINEERIRERTKKRNKKII